MFDSRLFNRLNIHIVILCVYICFFSEWFAQKIVPAFHAVLPEKNCGVYVQTVAECMMRNAECALASREKLNAEGSQFIIR